jgi:hypothetical protein
MILRTLTNVQAYSTAALLTVIKSSIALVTGLFQGKCGKETRLKIAAVLLTGSKSFIAQA